MSVVERWRAWRYHRQQAAHHAVLAAIDAGYHYGYDISRQTQLRGRLYPTLWLLEEVGIIRGEFVEDAAHPDRPRRRRYDRVKP